MEADEGTTSSLSLPPSLPPLSPSPPLPLSRSRSCGRMLGRAAREESAVGRGKGWWAHWADRGECAALAIEGARCCVHVHQEG
jgi:hypothetical protein